MMEPMRIMKMLETDMAMKTGIIRLLNSAGKILLDDLTIGAAHKIYPQGIVGRELLICLGDRKQCVNMKEMR